MAASRIVVDIGGDSASLQAAAAKAADALKGLADTVLKQTDVALDAGKKTVSMNDAVAKSYQRAAAAASSTSKDAAVAYTSSVDEQIGASDRLIAAQERQAEAAKLSAEQQVRANDLAAASAARSAERQVASAKKTEAAFGSSSSALSKAGKVISLGLLGAAAASVDLAVKFQSNTLRMQTQAGLTAKQLDQIRKGLLALAPIVAYTPDQLANGMYHVVSSMTAAQRATAGTAGELRVMAVAAKLAQVGHSDLEDTTYALVSALQSLHLPLADTAKLAGEVNAIVGSGDMTMTDFVESLKSGLLPAAHTAGISLQSVGAAMAAMGDQGMRGALAGTRLRMSIALLSSPSEAAAKILDTLGLSSKEATSRSEAMSAALEKAGLRTTTLSADLRKPDGISYALADLNQHLRESGLTATGAAAVMNKAFGGGRMGATITLLEDNLGRVDSKFAQIGRSSGQFGADWTKTTQTTSFELHQTEARLAALGTRIGTDLLPDVDAAAHDFSDFVGWLEKGGTAAHALEIGVGTLATVAIGSYFTSKVKQAITLVKDLRSVAMLPFKFGGSGGLTGASGGGIASSVTGGAGIWGARGPVQPGSISNPIIVAMEAGEYAGLGSMGAAGTVSTEEKVAQAESGAVESAGAGAVAAEGTGAAEAAAAGGIMASVKSGLGAALKGVGIAGIGTMGAQMAGKAIGGGAGRAVSDVGTGAAVGAGAGSIVPGIGTLTGAIGGAIVGGLVDLFHSESFGQKIAGSLSKGFGGTQAPSLQKQVATALDQLNKYETTTKASDTARSAGLQVTEHLKFSQLDPADQAKAMAAANKAGGLIARQLEAGWDQYKFQREPVMFEQLHSEIAKLPPQAQAAAVQSAVKFAEGLESQGRLAGGSAQKLLAQAESAFPGFEQYMGLAAGDGIKQFNAALNFSQAEAQVQSAVTSMSGDMPGIAHAWDTTTGDIQTKTAAVVRVLQQAEASGFKPMADQATADLQRLENATNTSMQAMAASTTSNIAKIVQQLGPNLAAGSNQAAASLGDFSANVTTAMSDGTVSTGKGMQLIIQTTNKALKEMGQKQLTPIQVGAMTLTQGKQMQLSHAPGGAAARGALIQVGNQGDSGRDSIPMSVGGQSVMVGSGEVAAVFTRHQQSVANAALSSVGGLPGLFQNVTTPHYMARGGFVVGASEFGGPNDPSTHGSDSGAYGTDVTGSIARLESGGSYFSQFGPHTRWTLTAPTGKSITATVTDMGSGGGSVDGKPRAIDLWWQTANALGLPGTSGDWTGLLTVTPAGTAGSIPGGGGPGDITAPTVSGTGSMANIVRGALAQTATAANAYLASQTPASTGGAGTPPNFKVTAGPVPAIVQRAKAYATSLLGRPYLRNGAPGGYGFDPPGAGLDCSGYVSTVLDAVGLVPGHQVSGYYESWGDPGPGKWITTGALGPYSGPEGHVMMEIDGTFFESGGHTSAGPHIDSTWSSPFTYYRHPPGLSSGGFIGDKGHQLTVADVASLAGGDAAVLKKYMAEGGMWDAANETITDAISSNKTSFPTKTIKPTKTTAKKPKPGTHAKAPGKPLGDKDLQALADVGGKVNSIWNTLQGQITQFGNVQTRYSTVEGEPQFINSDGSLNAAGVNQKEADDRDLISREQVMLGEWNALLPLVSKSLSKYLGKGEKITGEVASNQKQIQKDKLRIASIRTAILDLQKPTKNQLPALEHSLSQMEQKYIGDTGGIETQIKKVTDSYAPQILAAEERKQRYTGKSSATKRSLTQAVQALQDAEKNALAPLKTKLVSDQTAKSIAEGPLKTAITNTRYDQAKRKQKVTNEVFGLRQQINSLTSKDTKLSTTDTNLKAILTGAGGGSSTNTIVTSLESIAGQLGTANWGPGGKFKGIDTTDQGGAYNAQTEIITLSNDLQATIAEGAGSTTADLTQQIELEQQLALQIGEGNALMAAQSSVLEGFLPMLGASVVGGLGVSMPTAPTLGLFGRKPLGPGGGLPGTPPGTLLANATRGMLIPHYDQGGPVVKDTLAMVHAGEYVLPQNGVPVIRGGNSAPTEVHIHQHFHGSAQTFAQMVDQRIAAPENVRVVSRGIGQRTRMLRR